MGGNAIISSLGHSWFIFYKAMHAMERGKLLYSMGTLLTSKSGKDASDDIVGESGRR